MNSPIENRSRQISPAQVIVIYYILAVAVSTVLLLLPITLKPHAKLSFIDALFTAISAVSVTGLSTVNLSEILSVPGTFIFAVILQFGGIGIMAFGTFIWLMLGKKIGLRERMLIMTDQNISSLAGIVQLVKRLLILFTLIELAGAAVLGTYYLKYFPTWKESFLQGFFASVSALTNAGFDITGESLIPFAKDGFVLTVTMFLLIIGAIGFPVLMEVVQFFKVKNRKNFRFSLFTKITTITFFGLIIIAAIMIFILENHHFYKDMSWGESLLYSLFYSVSSRNGGLNTIDIREFSAPTHFLLSILMFIGASPSSAGGGIRTTTFAIMLLSIYYFANGNTTIKVFRREVVMEDVIKAYIVTVTATILCSCAVMLLMVLEPRFSFMEIVFEVASAFGTVGFSLGITSDLHTFGKIIIMVLMFIGRIGVFTFLFLLGGKPIKNHYHYPKERIIIG
ncbi:potassium uptake protein, TrkH family [Bacillus sp. OV322]|uniref:TrkH family potassium uptake protein n=1 Tax=Bacillus sp. OV322 TaxID=1882764 RepID=UPI0008F2F5D3|nr:TrkH family potassium uptake protein [Bacillus sp. OV322]SFD00237.1 potassium uptake protein, TrkH family [Bacillus sp. OV322]